MPQRRSYRTILRELGAAIVDAEPLNYVICSAPRTGSTLLAEALTSTGTAGRPNEYFDIYDYNEAFWKRSLNITDEAHYFDRVRTAATTPNGVFGLKLLWHQSPALIRKLRVARGDDLAAPSKSSLHELLCEKIGEPRYVWLRRRNKLAQSISYYRASRTGLWRSVDTRDGQKEVADRELPFDFVEIGRYLHAVNQFDAGWHAYFKRHRVKILMIVYENFIDAFDSTVHGVYDFLGLPREELAIKQPRLERQSDERSTEWEQRFLQMVAERQKTGGPAAATASPTNSATVPELAANPPKRRRVKDPDDDPPLPLVAYSLTHPNAKLVVAKPGRDWMDATPKRFAYRCLPMVIANQAGWLILNRHKFVATWNGGVEPAGLKIDFLTGDNPRNVTSLFGSGILTFTMGYLFRTPPQYNLYVHGPANCPKDGVCALEGIVESDWTESTFTMNWKVTRPRHPIVFEEDEPIAMITPMPRYHIERFRPEIRNLSEDPPLETLHREWSKSRQQHNADLRVPKSKAQMEGWQRHYMRGTSIRHEAAPEHQTALALSEFIDKRT